jgi:hypothetical protein
MSVFLSVVIILMIATIVSIERAVRNRTDWKKTVRLWGREFRFHKKCK